MNTCKTCKFRQKHYGCFICSCDKISEDYSQSDSKSKDMLIHSYNEGGSFFVGEDFGCIHHKSVDIDLARL